MTRLWVIAFALGVPATAAAADPDPAAADKLAAAALKAWDVPGAAVVVVRGEETLLLKGYGVRQLGRPEPVTPDTLFPLASCSKAFTTTLLAVLADDGVIGWDDPVRKHLPDFHLSDPNADALLTVRDLLCHRCGLGSNDLLWYHSPWSIDEVLKRAGRLPLDYPFRSGFRYSSIPFMVAGRAIEKQTGEKWEKLVRTRICEPLGMGGVVLTTKDVPADADAAAGHRPGKGGRLAPVPRYGMPEPNPSGSVHATARDLAAWMKFHLADGLDPNGKRLVSVKNLAETKTPQNLIRMEGSARVNNPDTVQLSYAMAWLVYDHRGRRVISHGGLIDGFKVQITMLPDENLGFAVLANLHNTRMPAALTNSLIDHYCGLPARDWNAYYRKVADEEAAAKKAEAAAREKARDPAKKPTLPAEGYSGEYVHPAYGTATATAEGGRLVLAWSNFRWPLDHFAGDTFRATDPFVGEQFVVFTPGKEKAAAVRFVGQEFKRK